MSSVLASLQKRSICDKLPNMSGEAESDALSFRHVYVGETVARFQLMLRIGRIIGGWGSLAPQTLYDFDLVVISCHEEITLKLRIHASSSVIHRPSMCSK